MLQFNSIRSKLIVIFLISLLGMLAITISGLVSEKNTLLEDRKVKTRHLVEAASGIPQHFHNLQLQGKMTESDAKAASLVALKTLRYEKSEYFWVNDMRPYLLMHPTKPELDGTDVSGLKDPEGKALFVAFADTVRKNGAGFVPYMWPKPGSDQPVEKISYVKGFEPWGWVLGSGIYIDDVDRIFRERAITLVSITLTITVLIGILLFFLIRGISRPIHDIQDTMRSIQQTKDLSRRVKVEGGNEISEIALSFNELVTSFQGLIHGVVANSHEVMSLSSRLSNSATQLAEESLNQSDASNDMAAAVEETQASIAEVSSNAQNAHKIAEQAGSLSQQGEKTVKDAANEMRCIATAVEESARHIEALGEMSGKISSIVNVIKEIADQTNLLALNAAIEAARAGEQGRGFAVVADEVRKLAERTTQSTVEIAQMISNVHSGTVDAVRSMEEGSSRVNGGVGLATEAGASMALIRSGAGQVITAVGDINHALAEQNEAVQLIVSRVGAIVTMAENNRSETGEIANTATRLEQIAQELEVMVDQFKT